MAGQRLGAALEFCSLMRASVTHRYFGSPASHLRSVAFLEGLSYLLLLFLALPLKYLGDRPGAVGVVGDPPPGAPPANRRAVGPRSGHRTNRPRGRHRAPARTAGTGLIAPGRGSGALLRRALPLPPRQRRLYLSKSLAARKSPKPRAILSSSSR